MKERIIEFLKKENKTASQFAEEINVQPSGISHILSGRNKPSLDFVLKMLEKYPYISTDWLLFGKGEMYRDKSLATLFDNFDDRLFRETTEDVSSDKIISEKQAIRQDEEHSGPANEHIPETKPVQDSGKLSKIVLFFHDRTFEEYFPAGR